MATAGGPDIERNGLVFGYDTGYRVADNSTSTRFYPGKNTNNLISNSFDPTFDSLADGNTCGFLNQLGTGNYLGVSPTISYKGTKSLKINRGTGGTGRVYRTLSLTLGQYLSVSCWVYSTTPGAILTLEYNGGDYSWGVAQTRNTHTGTGWEYLYVRSSSPATSNTTAYYFLYPSVQNQDTYWDNIQAENSQYPSPFLTGTRSSTQSLIDLTRTSTIDVSSVSFDSTGQPTFDGTNDYFVTDNSFLITGDQTWEVVAIANGGPDSPAGILTNHYFQSPQSNFGINYVSGNRLGASIGYTNGSREYASKNTSYVIQIGVPFHAVLKYDSSNNTIEWFINGESDSTYSLSATPNFITQPICSGRWTPIYNDYYFNGEVYVGKVYGRALTPDEVRKNYNAYKNRFNI